MPSLSDNDVNLDNDTLYAFKRIDKCLLRCLIKDLRCLAVAKAVCPRLSSSLIYDYSTTACLLPKGAKEIFNCRERLSWMILPPPDQVHFDSNVPMTLLYHFLSILGACLQQWCTPSLLFIYTHFIFRGDLFHFAFSVDDDGPRFLRQ